MRIVTVNSRGNSEQYLPNLDALFTPFIVAASQTAITIKESTNIKLIANGAHSIHSWPADTSYTLSTILDSGSVEAGKDYYIYLVSGGGIVASLNTTAPAGYTADNSRKIGGFHTLCCAAGTGVEVTHPLYNFITGAILPASVWCLNHRSRGRQEGTVWGVLDGTGWNEGGVKRPSTPQWHFIYMQSGDGVTTESAYGALIKDTRTWNDHSDDLAAVGHRLPTDGELQVSADGSNQRTNIWGSLKPGLNENQTLGYNGKCAITIVGKTFSTPLTPTINRTNYVPPVGATVEAQEYKITISTGHGVDTNYFTYQQRNPGGVLSAASAPIAITGAAQALVNGLTITFPAAVGFTTGWTITWYVMNGLIDTAYRRMVSNIGVEGAAGVMWQWLQDQSWRFDRGAVAYVAGGQTTTLYHAAAPGGNPIYVKFTDDGSPYLCSNLATVTADVVLTFGTNYKVVVKYDAGAATGLQLYFDYDATLPYRFLVNNTILGKDCYALTNDPNYQLPLKYDASAAVNGVAVNYDDGADNSLEYISPGAANATMDLAQSHTDPVWGYYDLGTRGQIYKQGSYGDIKLLAGGYWNYGPICGSRCRHANAYRWAAITYFGARGCAEPL